MDIRIMLAGVLWLLADGLAFFADSVEISRGGVLVAAGKLAGL